MRISDWSSDVCSSDLVREVEHALLADVHAVDDPKLHPGVRDIPPLEKIRNDADGAAAGAERGIGDDAHKTDPPATVDEGDPTFAEAIGRASCRGSGCQYV